jgi:hypothetical protein
MSKINSRAETLNFKKRSKTTNLLKEVPYSWLSFAHIFIRECNYVSFHPSNGKKASKLLLRECRKSSEVIPKGLQSYASFHLSNGQKAPKSLLRECRATFHFI